MTTLEEINLVIMAHDCHPGAPAVVSPLSTPPDMSYPGVLIVADSVDVFSEEPPGGPSDRLVCFSTGNVFAVLNDILERRRREDRQTVAMVVRVDDEALRSALSGDLVARIHMTCDSSRPMSA